MSSVQARSPLPFSPSGFVVTVFQKIVPGRRDRLESAQLREDLERLALGAPHILTDIGFERDASACSPTMTVWRKGALSVVVEGVTPSVSLSTG